MSTTIKTKKPKTPRILRKKPVSNETSVNIPSLNVVNTNVVNTNVVNTNVPLTINTINPVIENELMSYEYICLNSITIQNDKKIQIDHYIKALNKLGQKVYILIDVKYDNQLDADLTLIETKRGNILPYSLKSGAALLFGMDVTGVAFECDKNGLCVLTHSIDDQDDNLNVIESNFTFLDAYQQNHVVIENYGCHLSYPVVKLSEIRVNNQLVVEGTDIVTKKLRINAYNEYMNDLNFLGNSIIELDLSFIDFKNVIEENVFYII